MGQSGWRQGECSDVSSTVVGSASSSRGGEALPAVDPAVPVSEPWAGDAPGAAGLPAPASCRPGAGAARAPPREPGAGAVAARSAAPGSRARSAGAVAGCCPALPVDMETGKRGDVACPGAVKGFEARSGDSAVGRRPPGDASASAPDWLEGLAGRPTVASRGAGVDARERAPVRSTPPGAGPAAGSRTPAVREPGSPASPVVADDAGAGADAGRTGSGGPAGRWLRSAIAAVTVTTARSAAASDRVEKSLMPPGARAGSARDPQPYDDDVAGMLQGPCGVGAARRPRHCSVMGATYPGALFLCAGVPGYSAEADGSPRARRGSPSR